MKEVELSSKLTFELGVLTRHPTSKGSWICRRIAVDDLGLARQIRTLLKRSGAEVSIEKIHDVRTRSRAWIRKS